VLSVAFFSRIQPVFVVDVAGAIVAALKDDGSSMGKTFELGGPDVFTVHELVIYLGFCTVSIVLVKLEFIPTAVLVSYRQNLCLT